MLWDGLYSEGKLHRIHEEVNRPNHVYMQAARHVGKSITKGF